MIAISFIMFMMGVLFSKFSEEVDSEWANFFAGLMVLISAILFTIGTAIWLWGVAP